MKYQKKKYSISNTYIKTLAHLHNLSHKIIQNISLIMYTGIRHPFIQFQK